MTTDKMLTSKGKVLHMLHFFCCPEPIMGTYTNIQRREKEILIFNKLFLDAEKDTFSNTTTSLGHQQFVQFANSTVQVKKKKK